MVATTRFARRRKAQLSLLSWAISIFDETNRLRHGKQKNRRLLWDW